MTLRTLVARSLRFHWRAHLGVLLGATVSTAILVGARLIAGRGTKRHPFDGQDPTIAS